VAEKTEIPWCDATFNSHIGCTKVSDACDNCLVPDTPILYADMTWRPIGDAQPGDVIIGFDEYAAAGSDLQAREFPIVRLV
jgi:hypothetical protein